MFPTSTKGGPLSYRETAVVFESSPPSSAVLMLVLDGLLLCGLFCSVVSGGVRTAGVEGLVLVAAELPLESGFVEITCSTRT